MVGVGWACDHHITRVGCGKGRDSLHLRTWGAKHMLQLFVTYREVADGQRRQGPRAVDLDDRQTPTNLELGPLDNKSKNAIKNCSFLSGGWRGREQHSYPSEKPELMRV